MEIYFDLAQLDTVRQTLGATEEQAKGAFTRAVSSITASIKTRFGRDLAAIARAGYSPLTQERLHTWIHSKGRIGIVWVGLDPVYQGLLNANAAVAGVQVYSTHISNVFIIGKNANRESSGYRGIPNRHHSLFPGIAGMCNKACYANSSLITLVRGCPDTGGAQFQKALAVAEERLTAEYKRELKYELLK